MKPTQNNYAFIDSQNLNLGIKALGWKLDYQKFRRYLSEKYGVSKAYLFIGYLPNNQPLYTNLQSQGYILVFKPILAYKDGTVKGNVDAELVMHAMLEYGNYGRAVIISSDGDFHCLVDHLYKKDKLKLVLSPHIKTCSSLLKKGAREKIVFMDNLRKKLEYKKSTA